MTTTETGWTSLRRTAKPNPWRGMLRFIKVKPLGAAGLAFIAIVALVALAAPLIIRYDPLQIHRGETFQPPTLKYFFGTDEFGMDVFSRVVWGSRISLFVGFVSVALGTGTGALIGLVSGYFGRALDLLVQRVIDVLMAFPTLVLALAIVAALGASVANVIVAIAVVSVANSSRTIRSVVLSVKQAQYVEGARAIGCGQLRIMFLHILPNCLAPYIIISTASLGGAILTEASLSFLGLGTPPPEPSWGSMLSGAGKKYAAVAPWIAIFPGIAISMAVFGFNLFGDALRDVWDPKLRRG